MAAELGMRGPKKGSVAKRRLVKLVVNFLFYFRPDEAEALWKTSAGSITSNAVAKSSVRSGWRLFAGPGRALGASGNWVEHMEDVISEPGPFLQLRVHETKPRLLQERDQEDDRQGKCMMLEKAVNRLLLTEQATVLAISAGLFFNKGKDLQLCPPGAPVAHWAMRATSMQCLSPNTQVRWKQ
ncbi:hypothetical protein STEG23_037772 [Scotinomys teguina]